MTPDSKLRRLPETVINRIAAGEVVERPAAAVKELVENAIDAGATYVEVVIESGGQTLIRVTDDGHGMSAEELTLAVERHATSKLPDDDLLQVKYLGFRGEALPSIGAVSRLNLISRRHESSEAWLIRVHGGIVSSPEPSAYPLGTCVEVRDLFYATPARLKFMKSQRTERNHVVETIKRLAMAHSGVSFRLLDGVRTVVDLPAQTGHLFDARLGRLAAIMGREFGENALPIDAERDSISLTGFIGLPTLNRGNAKMQFLFVNGRPVNDRMLYGALRGAYRDVLASNRYPLAALFLNLPAKLVDVNVHPAKTEVRFRDSGLVRGLIVGSIRQALTEAGHRTATVVADGALGAIHTNSYSQLPYRKTSEGSGVMRANRGLSDKLYAPLPGFDARPEARIPKTPEDVNREEMEETSVDHPLGAACAQLHSTYVVAQTADGIVIVDQHAAHERLVQERIKLALKETGVARQALLIPEVVELDERDADRILARADELAEMGLIVEAFGDGAVVVRETPALLGEANVQGLIKDLVDDLADLDDTLALSDRIGDVCATMACHGSVRAGRQLNADEMNALLRQMEITPLAGQCSHGRPTYIELKLNDIEKLFGRR
ncbi:MAG: DNA mismatch repair endonuclease MutL [Magnetovibrio sp.]|nr:DNA mismatch repair endonuclease MutL [Magnetovibrio sp.]